jgi:hypothetical protein
VYSRGRIPPGIAGFVPVTATWKRPSGFLTHEGDRHEQHELQMVVIDQPAFHSNRIMAMLHCSR